jgi:hypothetical protein
MVNVQLGKSPKDYWSTIGYLKKITYFKSFVIVFAIENNGKSGTT